MADLPGTLVTLTRDQVVAKFLRDWQIRNPAADVGPKSQPALEAATFADQMMVVYADAGVIANGTSLETSSGTWLYALARAQLGLAQSVDPRKPAAGAIGFLTITASTGGGTIFAGDECRDQKTSLRFRCLTTSLYLSGTQVPIQGIDTGPATNLKAGTILTWTNPRPGIGSTGTVTEQSDGSGLSGGRDVETDAQLILRLKNLRANPPASGNDAAYQKAIESTAGLSIQKAFTYPAILGPGTMAFVFTMRPATPGASRIPNAAEIAQVLANLVASFPGDDGIFGASLVSIPTTVALQITWASNAVGWTDATPWPVNATPNVKVDGGATISATGFTLITSVDTTTPVAGQTIALYDADNAVFVRKRILTVTTLTANRRWTIAVDISNAASDTSFVPAANALASPWSESINSVPPVVAAYFETLGPGEQASSLPDPGLRRRRQPPSPGSWPSIISNRALTPVLALPGVFDGDLLSPTVPHSTTVGTPGVLSNLLELGDLAAFGS